MELAGIAAALSTPITPGASFVSELRARLAAAPVTKLHEIQSATHPDRLARPTWIKTAATAATLAGVAAAIAITLTLVRDSGSTPPPVSADVIKQSALNLFDMDTVRYSARVDTRYFNCFNGFNTPLTDEEKATLAARGEEPADVGVIYGCGNYDGSDNPYTIEETGVYDLVHGEFFSVADDSGNFYPFEFTPHLPDSGDDYFPAERTLVDGTLYTRSGDSEWKVTPDYEPWVPFQFPSFKQARITIRAVPFTDLERLSEPHENVQLVGEEEVDGVEVRHYRVVKAPPGVTPQYIDAWIGKDGLPRKAIVVIRYSRESQEEYLQNLRDRIANDPELAEWVDGPFFLRGVWPDSGAEFTYTYEFSGFNEPVSITAPVP